MKTTKIITALAAVTLLIGTTGMASAKKGGSNHGKTVSAAARSKSSSGSNHGQTVSEIARSKNKSDKNKSYSRDDDRWDRDDAWRDEDRPRTRSTTRQQRVDAAVRERNADIRAAHREYAERRREILNDGDTRDRLTSSQREQLRIALRERDRAIRAAQEEYRQAVRRLS